MKHKYKVGERICIKKNAAKIMYPHSFDLINTLSKYENQIHLITRVIDDGHVGKFQGRVYEILNRHWYSEEVIEYSQIEQMLEIENTL